MIFLIIYISTHCFDFRGRLKHGRHFTFKSIFNGIAITFVSTSVVGSFASEKKPFASHGPWLQVLITDDFIEEMLEDFADIVNLEFVSANI